MPAHHEERIFLDVRLRERANSWRAVARPAAEEFAGPRQRGGVVQIKPRSPSETQLAEVVGILNDEIDVPPLNYLKRGGSIDDAACKLLGYFILQDRNDQARA